MAVHDDKYLDFCAAYVLGALDGEELSEFEAHLKSGCPVCPGEIGALTEAAALLPAALSPLDLSPDLKEQVLFNAQLAKVTKAYVETPASPSRAEEVPAKARKPASRTRISWLEFTLGFAILFMMAGFSLYVYYLSTTINAQREYISTQQGQITKLLTELDRKEAILKVLESRRIEVVTMDGLSVNPVGYGNIIWDPEKKIAVLHVSNLPPVPRDKDYQLWVIKDQSKLSAGVFAVTDEREKESFFTVQQLGVADRKDIDAFAVTLEPKGGVAQPTGEIYLLGKTRGL